MHLNEHFGRCDVLVKDGFEQLSVRPFGLGDVYPLVVCSAERREATAHEIVDAARVHWGLTSDMSGGWKRAKPAGRRPLDGRVSRHSRWTLCVAVGRAARSQRSTDFG